MMRVRVCGATLVLLALSVAVAASEPPHREEHDDGPVRVTLEDQERSTPAIVVRGNFRSVQVNVDPDGLNIVGDAANEPSIAIDPTDPNVIVIGWRQFDTVESNFRQAGYAYSRDGGATWDFPGVLDAGQFRSDPVLAADSRGVFYYYSLSATDAAEMFVSTDGGENWTGPVPAFGGDKTWMTSDTTVGPGRDNVYAIWNSQFTCCPPDNDFTRSTDGGTSYDGPYSTPDKTKWGTVDVGPDGKVHVVGARTTPNSFPEPHLLVSSSNAQEGSQDPVFERTTGISLGGIMTYNGTPNPGGLMGQVWIATDRSGGSNHGNLYVLGSVEPPRNDPMDVMFARSTDGGATFDPPVRVHGHAPGSWQWFGTLSVAPGGRIDVVWNDTRCDPGGEISEVYYAYSTDAGAHWSEGLPVTPSWNSLTGHPNQAKVGDYYHMVSEVDTAVLAYAATFNGEQDIYFLRLGDCNANGVHDSEDISGGNSPDCDVNGIPDDCQDEIDCRTCDNDGKCEPSENCRSCPGDCGSGAGAGGCGNGTCEPGIGEDCLSCPADCRGVQSGSPKDRYCCGDGAGANPVDCGDSRCAGGEVGCSQSFLPSNCCGDGVCEGMESGSNCYADCAAGSPGEASRHDVSSDQMRVAAYHSASGLIEISYTPACDATQHAAHSGDLSAVSSYAYDRVSCSIGVSGNATFDPGEGNRFFLVVGHNREREGSYGPDSAGVERPEAIGTQGCDLPRDLDGVVCE